MKFTYNIKYILFAASVMAGAQVAAQTLSSAYFTDDYKFRHSLNPAFGNEQNYVSIPALGNLNVNMRGNFGYQDVIMPNPIAGGKEDDNVYESVYSRRRSS